MELMTKNEFSGQFERKYRKSDHQEHIVRSNTPEACTFFHRKKIQKFTFQFCSFV